MPVHARKSGEFCWLNLLTPCPDEARAFFTDVLGWTYRPIPGIGHVVQADGHPIGAIFDLTLPGTPAGTPPHIGVMVKVADAESTCARAAGLGGTSGKTSEIMGNLRMGQCADPSGAAFDLFEPLAQQGTDADPMALGAPSWFECMSRDAASTVPFYEALFGWTSERMPLPNPGDEYVTFKLGGEAVAGLMPVTPRMPDVPSRWGVYFTVRSADDAAAGAVSRGGTITIPPRDIPGVGRFAGLLSPQGVRFHVIQYAR